MLIGDKIKKRRKDLGISVKELAKAAGVSDKAIYQWEANETEFIRPQNLVGAAKKLKISVEELVTGEPPEGLTLEAEKLVLDWLSLTPELREVVIASLNQCKIVLKKLPQLRTHADPKRVEQFLKPPVKGKV